MSLIQVLPSNAVLADPRDCSIPIAPSPQSHGGNNRPSESAAYGLISKASLMDSHKYSVSHEQTLAAGPFGRLANFTLQKIMLMLLPKDISRLLCTCNMINSVGCEAYVWRTLLMRHYPDCRMLPSGSLRHLAWSDGGLQLGKSYCGLKETLLTVQSAEATTAPRRSFGATKGPATTAVTPDSPGTATWRNVFLLEANRVRSPEISCFLTKMCHTEDILGIPLGNFLMYHVLYE